MSLFKVASGGGTGAVAWGDITGTLSNQTDLQTALNLKTTAGTIQLDRWVWASSSAAAGGTGSIDKPFNSLQDAQDYLELTYGETDRKGIFIVGGSIFNEDVTITSGISAIIAFGPCTLGSGDLANFGSTTARNLTFVAPAAPLAGSNRPSLIIASMVPTEGSSTHTAYLGTFTISGNFVTTDPLAGNTNPEIHFYGVRVVGTASGSNNAHTFYMRRAYFGSTFNFTNGNIAEAENTEFVGLVTCASYGRLAFCEVKAGMTISSGPTDSNFVPPNGFFSCRVVGTFTGAASSFLFDSYTERSFDINGCSWGGSASINRLVLTASATKTGVLSSTDWSTFNGKEDPANKNAASGYAGLDVNAWVSTSNLPPYQYLPVSIGMDDEPTITSNGDGTVTVTACTVCFWDSASRTQLQRFEVAESIVSLTDLDTNHIVADHNTDTFVSLTDSSLIDYIRYIPVAEVYRSGTNVHVQKLEMYSREVFEKYHKRLIATGRYARESGFDGLAIDSSLKLTGNSGIIWSGLERYSIPAITASSRGFFCYHASGVWTISSAVDKALSNTQYDNDTDLVTMTDTYYAIAYIYRGIEEQDHWYYRLSTSEYSTLAAAQADTSIPAVPEIISSHAVFVGRAIIQKSQTTGFVIESAFDSSFVGSTSITDHGNLTGLSDADHPESALALTDVTTNNATSGRHGFLPKLENTGSKFLRDDGTWVAPSGSGDTLSSATSADNQVARYDGSNNKTIQASPVTISDTGTVNIPTGQTYDINGSPHTHTGLVTNGDSHDHNGGDGAQIAYSSLSGTPTLGTAAAKNIPATGDASATEVVYGTDTRLTNSRAPTSHATSHKSGGGDAIKLDELAAPTDVTTLNASSTAHGLLPKLENTATKYLRDDGTWQTIAGGGDVSGPASSTDNAIVRFNGTGGKTIQNSGLLIGDDDVLTLNPTSATPHTILGANAIGQFIPGLIASQDPRYLSWFFDDFFALPTTSSYPLVVSNNGTGAAVTFPAPVDATMVGMLQCATGTQATNGSSIISNSAIVLGTNAYTVEWRIRIPALSSGTQRFTLKIGLGDATAAGADVDSVHFEYVDNVNSGQWVAVATSNSARTTSNSSSAVAANTTYRLKIVINAAANLATFYVNDTSVATLNSGIPSGTSRATALRAGLLASVGTTTKLLYLDYVNGYSSRALT